jgi:CO/xanthine dehydrogenase Mo-binding subunit
MRRSGASIIGQRLPRLDAGEKATGRAAYVDDIHLPGMLHIGLVCSPYAHARVKGIDGTESLNLPGVVAMITAEDMPPATRPDPTLAGEEVFFEGKIVAAVAATDLYTARKAASRVVVNYEPLPAVTDLIEAVEAGAPVIHEDWEVQKNSQGQDLARNVASCDRFVKGDVEAAFADSDYIFEDAFRTQIQHQGFLEPSGAVAQYDPTTDSYIVWTTTAGQHCASEDLALLFRISVNQVRVIAMTQGGGFGGKNRYYIEPICMALARKTGRPVKLTLTREEEMRLGRGRSQTLVELKTGVKKDGTLLARKARILGSSGYTGGGGNHAMITGPYRINNVEIEVIGVATDTSPNRAFRAPGTPEINFAVESQMDVIARALHIDPYEIRMKNLVKEGDFVFWSSVLPKTGWRKVLRAAAERSGWKTAQKRRNHGRGIACGKWPCFAGRSSASVIVNSDGSVNVVTGAVDVSGSHTSLVQITAETLGVDVNTVTLIFGDSLSTPPNHVTAGSRTIYGVGAAVKMAAEDVKAQLFEGASRELGVKAGELEISGGMIRSRRSPRKFISVSELAGNLTREGGPIFGKGSLSDLPMAPGLAVQVAEVMVDPETGAVDVLRITCAQDVGVAINPATVEGQIEGAALQGLGYGLKEEYLFGEPPNCRLLNPSFLDYRLPTSLDAPEINCVLVEDPSEDGAFGARGIGEPSVIPTAAAIGNAVEDAVGVRIRDLPITPEKILAALKEKRPSGSLQRKRDLRG